MAVTEVATLPTKAGSDVLDKSSSESKTYAELLSTVSSQQGFVEIWHGREEETPGTIQWFINWKTLEDHHRFTKSEAYKPFMDTFGTLLSGDPAPDIIHFPFSTTGSASYKKTFDAPITEILTMHVATSTASEEALKTFESNVAKFCDLGLENAEKGSLLGWTSGWSVEEVELENCEPKGTKGKKFITAIGWRSLEDHMKYREHQTFKENFHLMRDPIVKGVAVHHVKMIYRG